MVSKVCVDPGHGMSNRTKGVFDPGAVHVEAGVKFQEAAIALRYGLTLRDEFRARGIDVFMSRDDDTDHAPVGMRATNAKNAGCGMLISLHLNDFDDDSANGVEVLYGDDADKALAQQFQTALLAVTKLRDRKIKPRPDLGVLKFKGPAVLIELGFIANDRDRETLLNPQVRAAVCKAIADVALAQ
ncbi:MAG: N-acetylmuramoyl-L-alanine amidase [Acetobacteraceae bacterium]|nr:N-acetylmuramoyl-L-alanine amidase [Acetobacteraceae bacterium]